MKDKCEAFRALIPQYASGELNDKTSAKLQRHITKCPDCSTLLDAQFESMDGSGKLYILETTSDNAAKKSKKRKRIIISSLLTVCIIIVAILTGVCLRLAGFVRISTVKFNECSLEYIQAEYPDILITESDLTIAAKATEAYEKYCENPTTSNFVFEISNADAKKIGSAGRNISNGIYPGHIMMCYKTSFHRYRLIWAEDSEPTLENISKTRYPRFRIVELIQIKRISTAGNKYFSEYIETIDLWDTLTRQELSK